MVNLQYAQAASCVVTWVAFFKTAKIPVLKQTAEGVAQLRVDEDNVSNLDIANVVFNDPMMVFKVLSYVESHKGAHQVHDVLRVEQALMMIGTSNFFNHIPCAPIVEDTLNSTPAALMDLLKIIIRAHRASKFSAIFAAQLADLHAEEVRVAALLHDLAEMLLWCFDTKRMQLIQQMQHNDPMLRSKQAQEQVLGFKVCDLQHELVKAFNLPHLLQALMEEDLDGEPRVKNVRAAVNLARHSADGWHNAALPDDYRAISKLLRLDVERVKHLIGAP